jgi:hypothetical protein
MRSATGGGIPAARGAGNRRGSLQLLSTDYKFAVSFVILIIVLAVQANGTVQGESGYEASTVSILVFLFAACRLIVRHHRGDAKLEPRADDR